MQQKTISNSFSVTPVYDGAPGIPGANGDTIWQAQAFKLFSGDPGNDKPSVTTNISASTTDFGNNWSAVPPSNNPSGVSKIDFSEVAGWKSGDNITIPSPGDGKNNTATIRFTTFGANAVVEIKITASSEANYDFGAIGKLDEKVLQSATASQIKNDASLSTVKVSGTGTATAQLTVAEPGEHFVQICYAKDRSSSSGNDNAVVQVLTAVTLESKIYSSVATVANGTVSGSWSNARPWQGATGSDGQSFVLYALEPSRDSLNFRSNAVGDFSPSSITVSCKVKKYVGNEIDVISNPAAAGLYVYYVKNGLPQSWQPGNSCTVNASEALAEQYTVTSVKFVLSTASSSTLVTEANTIVSVLLPVVCDGRRGSVGATGKMFYPMGTWDSSTSYTKTDLSIPVVWRDDPNTYNPAVGAYGNYWYLSADSSQGDDPNQSGQQVWTRADSFGLVITAGIFAEFAKLGKFIMTGDWMISCNGTIDGTAYNNGQNYNNKPAYTWFDPNYPNTDHVTDGKHNFIPNYAVDGLTGKSYQNDAYIKGTVHADSGYFTGKIEANDGHIGGFAINSSQIKSSNDNIILNSNGSATIGGFEIAEGGTARLKSTLTVGNATSQRIDIIPFLNGTYGSQAIEFIKSETGNNKEVVMELGFDNNNYGHIGIYKPATTQDVVDSFISIDADSLQINTKNMGDFTPSDANIQLLTNTKSSFSMFSYNEPTEDQKLFECGIRDKAITLRAYKSSGDSAWPTVEPLTQTPSLDKGRAYVMTLARLRNLLDNYDYNINWFNKVSLMVVQTSS